MSQSGPRFPLGRVLITPGAEALLTPDEIFTALRRHQHGDYGEVDEFDSYMNDTSGSRCGMVMSAYRTANGDEYWVKTHGTRSHTTILLPGE